MNILKLIGRNIELFTEDIQKHEKELTDIVNGSRFLILFDVGFIKKYGR